MTLTPLRSSEMADRPGPSTKVSKSAHKGMLSAASSHDRHRLAHHRGKVFAERFPDLVHPWARVSNRLLEELKALGAGRQCSGE